METPNLKDDRIKDRIIEDVLIQLRDGALGPGDKLAPVRKLCSLYAVSQRIVDQAKAELVERGILENRPRSGTYICPDALAIANGAQPESAGTKIEPTPKTAHRELSTFSGMFRYYFPKAPRGTLRVYVCEQLDASIDLWQRLLKEFREARPNVDVELYTCRNGHVADLFEKQEFDVVEATPLVLNAIGKDHFVDMKDFTERLISSTDVLEIVPKTGVFVRDFVGVPFSVSLTYLFINQSIAEQVGATDFAPQTADELIAELVRMQPTLTDAGVAAMACSGFTDVLFMSNALSLNKRGNLSLDLNKGIQCVETLAKPGLLACPQAGDVEAFRAGEAFCLTGSSFDLLDLLERPPDFAWRILPPPVNPQARIPAIMTTLAVSKNAESKQEALHLVSAMLTKRSQAAFGQVPGNLSVLRSALEQPQAIDPLIMPPGTREEALARSTLRWDEASHARYLSHGGLAGAQAMDVLEGRVTPAEAIERLWLMSR